MQHFTVTFLALAISVNAVPYPTGTGIEAPVIPFPTGVMPTGMPGIFPPGTGVLGATGMIMARKASSTTNATNPTTSKPVPSSTGTSTKSQAAGGGGLPASSGTSVLSAVKTIAAGESFDGGMVMYDRGVSCTGQSEGGGSDAVFLLEKGASISNVIIGPNQIEVSDKMADGVQWWPRIFHGPYSLLSVCIYIRSRGRANQCCLHSCRVSIATADVPSRTSGGVPSVRTLSLSRSRKLERQPRSREVVHMEL
jgi:hypothetical protein